MTLRVLRKLKASVWSIGTPKIAEVPGPALFNNSEIELLKQQKIAGDRLAAMAVEKTGRKVNSRIVEARKVGATI